MLPNMYENYRLSPNHDGTLGAVDTDKKKTPMTGLVLGALAGGTAGYLVGGPMGLAVGGVGGAVVGNVLMKPKEEKAAGAATLPSGAELASASTSAFAMPGGPAPWTDAAMDTAISYFTSAGQDPKGLRDMKAAWAAAPDTAKSQYVTAVNSQNAQTVFGFLAPLSQAGQSALVGGLALIGAVYNDAATKGTWSQSTIDAAVYMATTPAVQWGNVPSEALATSTG